MMRHLIVLVLAHFAFAPVAAGQDWPSWRGPNYDGSQEAKNLPRSFSPTENVMWRTALPGPGASTPIVVGEKVFLTAVNEEAGELVALCVDANSGKIAWQDFAGSGYKPGGQGGSLKLHGRSNYASPSAVADESRVVFFFGNGDLVSYSHDGERQWSRNLQKDEGDFAFQWTFSASPTLWKDKIFLPILQRDEPANNIGKPGAESFLLALDPKTGENIYKQMRPSDAVKESLESYATAIPYSKGKRDELLVVGGDVITGHDPATGAELWRWGTWNEGHREVWWRVVPSAVAGNGVALACGPKGAAVCAVRLGGDGRLDDDWLAWKSTGKRDPVTTDVPTPLFYDNDFFVLSDLRNALTRVDSKTGEHKWSIDLPRDYKWRASPTGADGRIWLVNHGGLLVVIDAEDGQVIHQVQMAEEEDDQVRSTVVVAHDSLFIRTSTTLFRIGS